MAAPDALGHRHPDARRLRELLRDPAARRAESRFVLEGPRLVADALERGAALEVMYVGTGGRRAFGPLVARVEAGGVPVRELKEGVLEKLGTTRTPQPVLAVAAVPESIEFDVVAPGLVVVTTGVQDPGNLGTIVRSAEAASAAAVVVAGGVDPWSPKVVRASAGSVLGVPVVVVDDAAEALSALRRQGRRIVGAAGDAAVEHTGADLSGSIALVVGSEAHGLSEAVVPLVDVMVRIPMAGAVESLNAGVAASVLMFEAARQTRG